MNIYSLLNQYKTKRKPLKHCEEYTFFNDNKSILDIYYGGNPFSLLEENWFNTIRSNIIIRGLINKTIIENIIKEHENSSSFEDLNLINDERINKLPHFVRDNTNIFMPFFSKTINLIYIYEPSKTLQFPYSELATDVTSCEVDPFDSYGFQLFDSSFTKLILISKNEKEAAFYYEENDAVYFVNNQGRLDERLFLFDKYLKHPRHGNIIERLKPVVESYFKYDQQGLIRNLYKNGFISSKFVSILNKKDIKR